MRELDKELRKPIIKKFRKRKVHSAFIDNIWSADIVDMQLKNNINKGFIFSLWLIDISSKYAWVFL